ncbi:MAG TPA: glycoside hydrolase family 140 protein [Ramlibacter sp.]|nr:glycoside hydrolase family 140 protein [Ramlibacter sp.]
MYAAAPFLRLLLLAFAAFCTALPAQAALPRLKVSENQRFLVREDGSPFFYLADTAWELLHRLNREETQRYLANRAEKGFTVIQTVVLAEQDGLNTPNALGQKPLEGNDPSRPNEAYFAHVDWVLARAEELGLYVALLPSWGDKWNKSSFGAGPEVFTPENAQAFGRYLGRRYKDRPVIWVVGGDRPPETDRHREIIRAMAAALREASGGTQLITFHPPGGAGSSQWFHGDRWLDFHMRQNGHVIEFNGRYDQTHADYNKTNPVRPVIDGEPVYEDHPISFRAPELGYTTAADVRRPLYWNLFAGAAGHAYGHHSVWQMVAPGRQPVNGPLMPWYDALNAPGAGQMQHGRRLIESRPFLTRVPDDSVIVPSEVAPAVPGAGSRRFVATRDGSGTYAMVYAPVGRPFSVRMNVIRGARVKAWWFNPRNGKAEAIGEFPNTGQRQFQPPEPGELLDWVLVLDDAAQNYPAPGTPSARPRR